MAFDSVTFFREQNTLISSIDQYILFEDVFTVEEIERIHELAKDIPENQAILGHGGVVNEIRNSKTKWFSRKKEQYAWMFEKCARMFAIGNNQLFHFNLSGFTEDLQYTIYKSEDTGFYSFHQDVGHTQPHRKLSLTIQLSDEDEYEGGDFSMLITKEEIKLPKKKGTCIIFPSTITHRVSPVTKGTRYSLVIWVSGPVFR